MRIVVNLHLTLKLSEFLFSSACLFCVPMLNPRRGEVC